MMILHANTIPKNGAMRIWAARVDGDDTDRPALPANKFGKLIDQCALPAARRASDAADRCTAGSWKNTADKLSGGRRLTFDDGGSASQSAEIAGHNSVSQFGVRECGRQTILLAVAARSPAAESHWCLRRWCTASHRDKTFPPGSLC